MNLVGIKDPLFDDQSTTAKENRDEKKSDTYDLLSCRDCAMIVREDCNSLHACDSKEGQAAAYNGLLFEDSFQDESGKNGC